MVTTPIETPNGVARPKRPVVAPLKVILFPARAFLALGWLRAGVEKTIELRWWTGEALREFVAEQQADALPFVLPVGDWVAGAVAPGVAAIVVVAELAIGICLLTAKRLSQALHIAIVLNIVFVVFGVVSPSAFYLVLQITLLLGMGATAAEPKTRTRVAWIAGCGASIVLLAPFVTTIQPAEVIHDPAVMLATVAGLLGVTHVFGLLTTRESWPMPGGSIDGR